MKLQDPQELAGKFCTGKAATLGPVQPILHPRHLQRDGQLRGSASCWVTPFIPSCFIVEPTAEQHGGWYPPRSHTQFSSHELQPDQTHTTFGTPQDAKSSGEECGELVPGFLQLGLLKHNTSVRIFVPLDYLI